MTRNQRERMYAAMVAAVAENGYEGTRVADVVKLSGVSRSAFYKHFVDKPDCFLATLDELAELARGELERHYDEKLPGEQRLRAVADALLDLLLEQPAAARLCLVEVYAAGPQAVERLDRAMAAVEAEVARVLDESPQRKGMPGDVVRALVGGVRKTVHTRVRRGEEAELIEQLPQLIDWVLSHRSPPERLRRPRRRPDRGAAPQADHDLPRERLVTAVTETIAERGYSTTTIIEIANRASASLSTFYEKFENKEEALLAALDREREQSLATVDAAYAAAPDWPQGIRAGIDALFGFFAAEPAAARVALVEAFTAGPEGLEAGDRMIRAFHPFFEPGHERKPATPPLVSEAVANAVYSLAYAQVRAERTEQMRELTPTATFVALTPFMGAARACRTANS